jgi:tetratricopeptide (TPR) repeat protein
MATLLELAKDAFKNHNYILSCEIYERLLRESGSRKTTELYFGYGDSLAKCDRIKEALDIYAHICYQLCEIIPVEKLKCLASSIIEFIVNKRTNITNTTSNSNNNCHLPTNAESSNECVDALYCPICEDILKYPVTSLCGHTFCRECCFGRTKCIVCGQKFPIITATSQQQDKNPDAQQPATSSATSISTSATTSSTAVVKNSTITSELSSTINNNSENGNSNDESSECMDIYQFTDCSSGNEGCGGFEQDILVRRLLEKWWSPHLKASELNDEAENYLHRELLDEALKCCNQSLEHGESHT